MHTNKHTHTYNAHGNTHIHTQTYIQTHSISYQPYTKSYARIRNMYVTSTYMHVDPNMPVT